MNIVVEQNRVQFRGQHLLVEIETVAQIALIDVRVQRTFGLSDQKTIQRERERENANSLAAVCLTRASLSPEKFLIDVPLRSAFDNMLRNACVHFFP